MKKEWNGKLLLICFALVIIVAAFGSIFTTSGVKSDWYESSRPSLTPPNWVFGPVWTILYILIALSLYFVWDNASTIRQRKAVAVIYGFNLVLNAIWSFFYFGIHNAPVAFIDIVLMWISTIWMITLAWNLDRKAAWMLVPYLIWITFAAVLNFLTI